MKVDASGISETGPTRPRNEDAIYMDRALGLYILADGMGGHQGGAEASALTVRQLYERLRSISVSVDANIDDLLRKAIVDVNAHIFSLQSEQKHAQRMGSTLVCAWFFGDRLLLGSVGDSRCYRMRSGRLQQLTIDHTLWERMRENEPEVTTNANRAFRSTLTKVMGTQATISPDIGMENLRNGDRFLLCSDGLSNELAYTEISEILESESNSETAARKLVDLAVSKNAKDNVSVIVIDVKDVTPSTVKFSKSLGPIRRQYTNLFSIISLSVLLVLALYAWYYTSRDPSTDFSAVIALAEGRYAKAEKMFETQLSESTDGTFTRLQNRLGLTLAIWRQSEDSTAVMHHVIASIRDAEDISADLSDKACWPAIPPEKLLDVFRDVARTRWTRNLVRAVNDELTNLPETADTIRLKIKVEETGALYYRQLKIPKAMRDLDSIKKELSQLRR